MVKSSSEAVCNLLELDQLQNIRDHQLLDYHHSNSQLSVHNQRRSLKRRGSMDTKISDELDDEHDELAGVAGRAIFVFCLDAISLATKR